MDELARRELVLHWLDGDCDSFTDHVTLFDVARQVRVVGKTAVFATWDAFWGRGLVNRELTIQVVNVENEVVYVRGCVNGRQAHAFWGLPCTGRDIALPMTIICTCESDQISRIELRYDARSLLRQLGLGL